MEITDVRIRKLFSDGPMRAIVSVTFDGEFAVHDIKVISASGKNFIVMPSRKNADGSNRDICHPIVASFREELETRVMEAFHIAVAEAESETQDPYVIGDAFDEPASDETW